MATKSLDPHFDADAMRAAQQEPTLTVGSLLYRGRLLSAVEWFGWNEQLQALRARIEKNHAKPAEILDFYERFFRELFPRSRRRWWAPDPVTALMRERLPIIEGAFDRFFELQAQANGVSRKSPSTSGTSSSDSTPDAPAAGPGAEA